MRAIVQERYDSPDLLELREIDRPNPEDDEVLVGVRATSVHADVWHAVHGVPYVLWIMGSGLRAPKHHVPGTDARPRRAAPAGGNRPPSSVTSHRLRRSCFT